MCIRDRQGVNGSDEAVISIYRQGELKGSFVDNGNGELNFSSEDGSVAVSYTHLDVYKRQVP